NNFLIFNNLKNNNLTHIFKTLQKQPKSESKKEDNLKILNKYHQDRLISELKRSAGTLTSTGGTKSCQAKEAQHEPIGAEEEGGHPFSEAIMAFPMPKNLKAPAHVDPYCGNTDPQEHMDSFLVAMSCQGAKDAYKCRTFPLTLKKTVLRWYSKLEPNSITCWKDMAARLLGHFTTSKAQPKSNIIYRRSSKRRESP
ncbi:MAG: hypothetical protein Q8877_03185, partial [Sweet potato little leaf phytoplasma]|nr:hypothetical protein [Sweet potato little leaf phytoplasma]